MELWRAVIGYEDYYEVSDRGRVRRIRGGRGARLGLMRVSLNFYGYARVTLCRDCRGKQHLVLCLVAAAFLGPCPPGKEVNHIDGNKANPALVNLEYVTSLENKRHARGLGLMPLGSRVGSARLSEPDVAAIKALLHDGESPTTIAPRFGVNRRTISDIDGGITWGHVLTPH